jgi:hypothetical protein
MKARALACAACTVLVGCTSNVSPQASGTVAQSPLASQPVFTIDSAFSWDGVDQRPMLVTPMPSDNKLAAWTFYGSYWKPAAAPPVVASPFVANGCVYCNPPHTLLAYDSARNREVLIVSRSDGTTQTWEWDGKSWHQVKTLHSPPAITAGTYSPQLRSLVADDGAVTWIYDGIDWRAVNTTLDNSVDLPQGVYLGDFDSHIGPAQRLGISYDPKLGIVALNYTTYATEVWTGSDWSELSTPSVSPFTGYGSGRWLPNVIFDPDRGDWVLQGGAGQLDQGWGPLPDTSLGDGTSWRVAAGATSPGARYRSLMAWDPIRQEVLLAAGSNYGRRLPTQVDGLSDVWAWDGASWRQLAGPAMTQPVCAPNTSYGLLLAAGNLDMVNTCGEVAASAPIAAPSVQTCSSGGPAAALAPPVSATKDLVFYRDGNSTIRSLDTSGHTAAVTTVPGGPTMVSFFSVSPDDRRIAVVIEDLSPADHINLRLYAEDLHGGGHHVELFSRAASKNGGTTLWPMGWHNGDLLIAVMPACAADTSPVSPVSWAVVDSTNANRLARIDAAGCGRVEYLVVAGVLSQWPSPQGIVCVTSDSGSAAWTSDWTGNHLSDAGAAPVYCPLAPSGLSPAGDRFFESAPSGCPGMEPFTDFYAGTNGMTDGQGGVAWHVACLWIDEDHLLAPDAVITYGDPTPILLSTPGACAGQFPVSS